MKPIETRVKSAWFQLLKPNYDKTAFKFCFQFQLTALHHGLHKQWYAGREARFVLTARDEHANALSTGGRD